MSLDQAITGHYTHGDLVAAIQTGVEALGKTTETVTVEDLAPIDEFHIGGRAATEHFMAQLPLDDDAQVLDVGCGLGGPARFVASRFGCRVTGIDLTPEFVETGKTLCAWVGLENRISLHQGSAAAMPFEGASFDAAYIMHVGMNIPDKPALFAEIARVLKPGGVLGVYEVMRTGDGDLQFPVPWATEPATSFVATPDDYRAALTGAGLSITAELNRREFAQTFFAELTAKAAQASGPPPLGLHVLMGESRAAKVKNMVANIASGLIAPVEMIARKP